MVLSASETIEIEDDLSPVQTLFRSELSIWMGDVFLGNDVLEALSRLEQMDVMG